MKISVLGAGTWGIALARVLCNCGHNITVWSALHEEINRLSSTYKHPNLPNMEIPESIVFTDDIQIACLYAEIIIFAVPSVYIRTTAKTAAPFIDSRQIVVNVSKGIETGSMKTMSEILGDELNPEIKIAVLSGPTHAEEVLRLIMHRR